MTHSYSVVRQNTGRLERKVYKGVMLSRNGWMAKKLSSHKTLSSDKNLSSHKS